MKNKFNKFLIVLFIGSCVFGSYLYFYNGSKTEAADSPLSSSLNTTATATNSGSDKATEDIAFLKKLASLTTIKIDITLFSNKAFNLLVDNKIKIEPVPYGRINPFSPADKETTNNKPVFSFKTNPATLITNKSAVLNGSIEGATSNNIYFEYGETEKLGKITPKVTASLVGSFAYSLTLLDSGATYFFRAVSNINGVVYSGDIISFKTN